MNEGPVPQDPPPMSRNTAIAYAVGSPLTLFLLIFLPAGRLDWSRGWALVALFVVTFGVSALLLARLNPVIYRARSRFQPGTLGWDRKLLAIMLPAMVLTLPLAALDGGRFHWSRVPDWLVAVGYVAVVACVAITTWAQAVNPFFEPGVRIQTERHQRVIDTGPYRFVRHPGYVGALLLFAGIPLALGSCWGLAPAAVAGALLVVRTSWEDRLLSAELAGYADYARRVRYRLVPGLW